MAIFPATRRYARRAREEDEGVPLYEDLEKRWEREIERLGGLPETEEQQQTDAVQSSPGLRFDDLDVSSLTFDETGVAHVMVSVPNAEYAGQLNRDGSPHGVGRLTYTGEDPSEYLGDWCEGRRHGWGKQTQADGDVLEGQWDRDVFSGEGRLSEANGGIYDGQWQWNRPYGDGRYVLPDGTVFEGVWGVERDFEDPFTKKESSSESAPRSAKAGAPEEAGAPDVEVGIGTIRYPNHTHYDGEWRGLRPHGTGTLTLEDGSVYKGEFEEGLFHGTGRLRYANRAEYEGEWRDGRKQGRGRMVHPDGKVETGHWKRDRLIEVAQDQEHYMDAVKGFVLPGRHKRAHERGVPDAEIVGPAEARGKWAGRRSGGKKAAFDRYAADVNDDELDEDEDEDEEGGNFEDEEDEEDDYADDRYPQRNAGITQGYRKSTSYSRWAPLKGRGRA